MSDITTGNFVCIEQTPATVGDRIFGRIIDLIALSVYFYAVTAFLFWLPMDGTSMWQRVLVLIILYVPAIGYTFLSELLFGGRTLGKYIMKTRVVMADGSSPTMGALLLRYVCEMVDIWMGCIGLVFIIGTRRHQRLGDLAAGTMVVRTEDMSHMRISISEFAYARRGYTPTYANATLLSPRQADILRRTVSYGDKAGEARTYSLAAKVAHLLSLPGYQWQTDCLEFLRTVLNDYMFLTQSREE